jgi:Fe-S-cluster containining protein
LLEINVIFPGDGDIFSAYTTLLEKIDRRLGQMPACACPDGCDRCCRTSFTLFPVEAFHMREAFLHLPPETADRVRKRAAANFSDCPFLLGGLCAVYAGRPVLCRMHGHPFLRAGEGEDGVEIYPGCEQFPLESLPMTANGTRKVSALDLDGINQLLAAVNDVFWKETGPGKSGPCSRISVRDVPGDRFPEGEGHADL